MRKYSDTTKLPWREVWDVNIYEFFNIIAFAVEYDRRQAKAVEEWKRKH